MLSAIENSDVWYEITGILGDEKSLISLHYQRSSWPLFLLTKKMLSQFKRTSRRENITAPIDIDWEYRSLIILRNFRTEIIHPIPK